jgi:26S proteasome non-ATPase regulatory subunit 10
MQYFLAISFFLASSWALSADIRNHNWYETLIHLAVEADEADVCQFLIDQREDINAKDKENNGRTPLHLACARGHYKIVLLLLDNQADIHAIDNDGNTALMLASAPGHKDIVLTLLKHGALINAKNKWQENSCLIATQFGKTDVLRELIKLGADINTKDAASQTPLEVAIKHHNEAAILLLLFWGADPSKGLENPFNVAYHNKKWQIFRPGHADARPFFKIMYDLPAKRYLDVLQEISQFQTLPEETVDSIVRWIVAPWTIW